MASPKKSFNVANMNDPHSNIVAKIYVILKTPENDPLMLMGNPRIDPSFSINVMHGQSKKEILKQVQSKIAPQETYDATVMLSDISEKWSYKTTNTINSRFDVMNVVEKQLYNAAQSGKINMPTENSALQLNAA